MLTKELKDKDHIKQVYQKTKNNKRELLNLKARDVIDLIIPPVDINRRNACERDLKLFLQTYFPNLFYKTFSNDHLKIISNIQSCVLKGGLYCMAAPRGIGKSTITEASVVWALIYGHRKYIVPICASQTGAEEILENVKTILETNDLLDEDFSEVTRPIRALKGVSQSAKSQTCGGNPTKIEFGSKRLTLANICIKGEYTISSGSILYPKGIGSSFRGLGTQNYKGQRVRPDFVFLDDVQDEESAESPDQIKKLEKTIQAGVLGLAGVGKTIAAICTCTVLKKGDLADRMLDRTLYPQWSGERFSMLYSFPTNKELWDKYASILKNSIQFADNQNVDVMAEPNNFYLNNKKEMDEGANVAWEENKEDNEISALQHAMNLFYLRGEVVFSSEFQNKPISDLTADLKIEPKQIVKRINVYDRTIVPPDTLYTVCFTDINQDCLSYTIASINKDTDIRVIEYGKIKMTINDKEPEIVKTTKLISGLNQLEQTLKNKRINISRLGIDGGYMGMAVRRWIESKKTPYYLMTKGIASIKYRQTKGDLQHFNQAHLTESKILGRFVMFNSCYYREKELTALACDVAMPGSISLYNAPEENHYDYVNEITAETLVGKVQTAQGLLYSFAQRPGQRNDWQDSLIGCMVMFATLGIGVKVTNRLNESGITSNFNKPATPTTTPTTHKPTPPVQQKPKPLTPRRRPIVPIKHY